MKVIVDGRVWLPTDSLTDKQQARIRAGLTIQPESFSEFAKKQPDPILLFEETETHIGVPRQFYAENASKDPDFESRVTMGAATGLGMTPGSFKGRTDERFAEQNQAHDSIVQLFTESKFPWAGGILQAGCAFGKTVVALRIAATLGRRTLVIVNRGFFMRQWTSRIAEFYPAAKIGYVQQNTCDYRGKDIVIAMVHSLAARRYEEEFYSAFGLVITDETHRIGAPTWSGVIPDFAARWRLGLTATPRRKDGTERVFFDNIGPVVFSAKSEAMIPVIAKRRTKFEGTAVKWGAKSTPVHQLNSAQLLSQAAGDLARTRDLVDVLVQAVRKHRKILVVSERLEQLWTMRELLENASKALGFPATWAFATGQQYVVDALGARVPHPSKEDEFKTRVTTDEDLDAGESAQVLFATKQMIEEGFDISALDVLILATPIGDIEQTAGRVRRWCFPEEKKCAKLCPWRAGKCAGKPDPIIVDPVDDKIDKFRKKWNYRHAFYKKIGAME